MESGRAASRPHPQVQVADPGPGRPRATRPAAVVLHIEELDIQALGKVASPVQSRRIAELTRSPDHQLGQLGARLQVEPVLDPQPGRERWDGAESP